MDKPNKSTGNERVSWETLHSQIGIVKRSLSFKELSTAKSENVFVLNTHRQIVFITRSCLDLFNIEDPATVYGCRPGEAMHCTHAQANGCGTSAHCKYCGARNAALASLGGTPTSKAFKLHQIDSEELIDFTVSSEAITLEGQLFLMVSLTQGAEA